MNKNILEELNELLIKKGINEEEIAPILNEIRKQLGDKKYGLVWEGKDEESHNELLNTFPVLKEIAKKEIKTDINKPINWLIEGDNLYSLMALQDTHAKKTDIIYIDPPYNLGNKEFNYNDRFVNKHDTWKHSNWLNFMNKRLKLAKGLLSNDKQGITSQTEHILVYANSGALIKFKNSPLREDYVSKTYKNPDNDPRGRWRTIQIYKKKNPNAYTVVSPTGKEWTLPWNYSEDNFKKLIKENLIYWG